jgi:hypothetical protein
MKRTASLGIASLLLLAAGAGCSKAPTPEPVKADAKADAKADEANKPPPLTEEDKRLIAADPATLTPEERRKRGYALRRKIMQNPDSPAARTLNDLAKAAKEGTIDPNSGNGMVLHQAGAKPEGGAPPAGYRPPEADGKDQSKADGDTPTP